MTKFLDLITDNLIIFGLVMFGLLILLIVLIHFIRKNKKNMQIPIYEEDLDKGELDEVNTDSIEPYIEELESITDEEIIERVEEEHNKEVETVIETSPISDIELLLNQMREDRDAKPEEVVAKFEAEQEESSIISYKELVEMVKNNKTNIYDDEQSELPRTSSVYAVEEDVNAPTSEEVMALIDKVMRNSKKKNVQAIENEKSNAVEVDDNTGKFRPDDVVSPVFGRVIPDIEYTKIPQFEKPKPKSSLSNVNLVLGEKTMDLEELDQEIKKSEDFLKALKDFRSSL